MHIIFDPDISKEAETFLLDKDESKHTVRVLRKKTGDKVWVVNGKGAWMEGEIIDPNPKACTIKITRILEVNSPPEVSYHIAIAPPKNVNRFEWFLEKAAELGVSEITPVLCQRSERKRINEERSNKKLISALKQSQGLYLPKLNSMIKYKDLIQSSLYGSRFIATITDETKNLKDMYKKGKDAVVLIGPEGDFTDSEVELASTQGFSPVSLGEKRLRVETAGVIALHTLILKNE